MGIDYQNKEYTEYQPIWQKIDDCTRLKNLESYIPKLNPDDNTSANIERNKSYKERAVFYAIARQTIAGILGLMFSKAPKMELPVQLDYMLKNVDGAGISIYQQMQATTDDVNRFGRAGLYTSYPKREGPASRADIQSLQAVATISRIEPKSIRNWRTMQRGAQVVLSLVVLDEKINIMGGDGYTVKEEDQLRELYLEENVYSERLWRRNTKREWVIFDEYTPRDSSGSTFNTIQFFFVGSENNDHNIDSPPIQTLVDINLAHYLDSADWQDSIFYSGQSQPWMSGVNQSSLDNMAKAGVYVGGRNPIMLPEGGTFGFATAEPNPIVRQAMIDKVEIMVGLGALMLQPTGAAKTATQAAGEQLARHSISSMIAKNVSEAYTTALKSAARFMGATDDPLVEMSSDFIEPATSPQELQAIMAGFIQGSVPIGEYVNYMKKRGFFDPEKDLETLSDEMNV